MFGVIKRHFKYLTTETLNQWYHHMLSMDIQSAPVTSVGAIESLERVQKKATKLIHGFEKISYTERLRKCEIPTLKYRRIRGNIIETYKIITGM